MAELVNLRNVRKRAKRQQQERHAEANRLANGLPKHLRNLAAAQRTKVARDLDRRRIEEGDGR